MELIDTPRCPCCGGSGTVVHTDCRDRLFGVEGAWNYRRCETCASLWADPRPADHEIPKLYRNYYTHTPPRPFAERHRGLKFGGIRQTFDLIGLERYWGYRGLVRAFGQNGSRGYGLIGSFLPGARARAGAWVRYLPARRGGRLLDVGCGNGQFLLHMKEFGWEAQGIEPDANAVSAARTAGLAVVHGWIRPGELPRGPWDAITLNHVIEHLPDPRSALVQLWDVLAPGGVLVSISPNPCGPVARWFGRNWRGLEPPRHLVLPSREGYRYLCAGLGGAQNIWGRNDNATGLFRDSWQLWRRGTVEGPGGWWIGKGYGYVVAPMLSALQKSAGDELVCVLEKPR